MIEMENKSYFNIINNISHLSQSSNSDLEKLVQILEGNTLKNWNTQKESYLIQLEKVKNWWGQEIYGFKEKLEKELKEMV